MFRIQLKHHDSYMFRLKIVLGRKSKHVAVMMFQLSSKHIFYSINVVLVKLYIISNPLSFGGTVVKLLCYKSEGRWFDPSWCHWNFSLT